MRGADFVNDPDRTSMDKKGLFRKRSQKKDYGNLTVLKSVVAGAHLWHERT